jgi:phosphohistidine phosphatase
MSWVQSRARLTAANGGRTVRAMADTPQLYLLRHADAGDPDSWRGDDAARPLSPKGRRQAELLGTHLAAIGFAPDAVITSPRIRAAETAELAAAQIGRDVTVDDRLGSGVDLETVAAILDDIGSPRRVVLVGHDPDFTDVLSTLVGADVPMKKGAIARVDLRDGLRDGGGVLRWLLPPDLLPEHPGS